MSTTPDGASTAVPPPITATDLVPESDESSDADSAIGGVSYASSTTSAKSEVYQLVEEFGRTYHGYKSGKYILPNDEKERDRLDLQHVLWLITTDGALATAPLEDPRFVLDIATGTGIWAMDFAEQHPNARVVGTDLSPIQPTYVPINCTFEIHDAEDVWDFSRPFDYVHGRALLSCFTNPKSIIQKAYDALSPGGWLELQDGLFPFFFLDPKPPPTHPIRVWGETALEASRLTGRPWDNVPNYKRWLEEIGFVDVVEQRYQWPCGPWAKGEKMKKLGIYFREDMKIAVEAISLRLFCKVLGWEEERVRAFVNEVVPLLGAKGVYAYFTVVIVYGRKPVTA